MSSPLRVNLKLFLSWLVVLTAGWLGSAWVMHRWPVEGWIRFGFDQYLLVPWLLPRWAGLSWLALLAVACLIAAWQIDRDDSVDPESDAVGIAWAMALMAMLVLSVVAGIFTLVSFFTGAWGSFLATAVLAWWAGRGFDDPTPAALAAFGLMVTAAVGMWTGLFTGLYHGLLFSIVYAISTLVFRTELVSVTSPSEAQSA